MEIVKNIEYLESIETLDLKSQSDITQQIQVANGLIPVEKSKNLFDVDSDPFQMEIDQQNET